ncbi:MAG: universal stress protein [Solirubrobacteraceae bacterium]
MTPQTPRVLLAASGSEASRRATVIAADLASTFDAELTIVHVVAPVEYRVGRLAPTLPIITRQLDDPLTCSVLLESRRVAWANGANAKTILVAGDPARVIVAIADDLGADLVIGSTSRLRRSVLAAKTRHWVNARSPCPVLPVPANRPPSPRRGVEPALVT